MNIHELDLFLRPVNPGDTTTFDIGDGRVREEHICVWTATCSNEDTGTTTVYRCALRWDDGSQCDTRTTVPGWFKAARIVQRQPRTAQPDPAAD